MRLVFAAALAFACRPPPVNNDPYASEPLRKKPGEGHVMDLQVLALHTGHTLPARFGVGSCDGAPSPDLGHYCAGRIGEVEDEILLQFAHGIDEVTCHRVDDERLALYCQATASAYQRPNDCTVLDRIKPDAARAPYSRACLVTHMALPKPPR